MANKRARMDTEQDVQPVSRKNVPRLRDELASPDLTPEVRAYKLRQYMSYRDSLPSLVVRKKHSDFIDEQLRQYQIVLKAVDTLLDGTGAVATERAMEVDGESAQAKIERLEAEIDRLTAQVRSLALDPPVAPTVAPPVAQRKVDLKKEEAFKKAQATFTTRLAAKCEEAEKARRRRDHESDNEDVLVDCGLGRYLQWYEKNLCAVTCLSINITNPGPYTTSRIHRSRGKDVFFDVRGSMSGHTFTMRCSAYALRHWESARQWLRRHPAFFPAILEFEI